MDRSCQAIRLSAPEVEYEVLFLLFVCGIIVALEEAQDRHVTRGVGGGVKMVSDRKVVLIIAKWEELKEMLLRVKMSSIKWMRVSVEGNYLGLWETKKRRETGVQGLDVHGEDEVLRARELEGLEEVEGMSSVLNVGGEFLDQGIKDSQGLI
eukprot:g42962.t1